MWGQKFRDKSVQSWRGHRNKITVTVPWCRKWGTHWHPGWLSPGEGNIPLPAPGKSHMHHQGPPWWLLLESCNVVQKSDFFRCALIWISQCLHFLRNSERKARDLVGFPMMFTSSGLFEGLDWGHMVCSRTWYIHSALCMHLKSICVHACVYKYT